MLALGARPAVCANVRRVSIYLSLDFKWVKTGFLVYRREAEKADVIRLNYMSAATTSLGRRPAFRSEGAEWSIKLIDKA